MPVVLHLINSLESGGTERMLSRIVLPAHEKNSVDGQGDASLDQLVVTLKSGGKYEPILRTHGVSVENLGLHGFGNSLAGVFRLIATIRARRPDVMKCWMYHANLFGLLALWLSGQRRKTTLYWGIRCSDTNLSAYGVGLRWAVRLNILFSGLADAIIFNSWAGVAHHRALGFGGKNWAVIDNGVDIARFQNLLEDARMTMRRRYAIPPDVFLVGTVGRNDPMKGYDLLCEVLEAQAHLWGFAAGSGTEALSTPDNKFTGIGDVDNIENILPGYDIFVLASLFGEGQSNALMEAMAAGCPVIATDVGDNAYLVGDAGLVVPPGDKTALGAAIHQLHADPDLCSRLGRDAAVRIARCFPIVHAQTQYRTLFHQGIAALDGRVSGKGR